MATVNVSSVNSSAFSRCGFINDFNNILLPVTYSVVLVFGLLLNLTVMYTIVFRIKHWSPNTIYMINLTVCDTLYILTLPFLIYYHAIKKKWPFSEAFCKLIRFLFYTNLYGSILFLTCISVHRYIVVCHPVRSMGLVNASRARYVSVLVWVVVLIFQAPVLYFTQIKEERCSDTTADHLFVHFLPYSSFISVSFFLIPFLLVIVCNSLMVRKLIQPSRVGGAISQNSKRKSVKMIVIVMLVFIVCFVPFHLTRSLHYVFRYLTVSCNLLGGSRIAYKVSRHLASINSCIDPILYFLAGQGFRRSLPKKMKQDQNAEEDKHLSSSQTD
ncbi:P2Y purinoceptor 2-like [Ictalurus furcatus]|uniref:P2Y purinoceptor 2-like n=1 Tax=Ictalurus furcatus TaxID=66913 RepID=UPI00234FEFC9|nr:P2Y purinoceptor 2-like [Ictalurus furcatus]